MKTKHVMMALPIAATLATLPLIAQATTSNPALAGVNTAEAPRVTQAVDNHVVAALNNTHLAFIDKTAISGSVDDAMPMNHMQLILRPSASRASALAALIADQHDPASAKFRQWLTPEEFGAHFGVVDADIAAVKSWLISQGFTVNGVYPNKAQIDFSGTAGQVRQAFRTQENRYLVNHVSHIANANDISVPSALRDVVVGVAGLNDFRPQPLHVAPQVAQFDHGKSNFQIKQVSSAAAGTPGHSAVNFTGGVRGFVPFDMQTIYNTSSLYVSGLTGAGITIAVVEDQDMDVSDWPNFVSQFGLGAYGGTFNQFQPQLTPSTGNCTDPGGNSPDGESIETVLDSEYSTAMAPGAAIWVATCADSDSTNFFGGVFTAADNLINNTNPAGRPNVISASYGYGEGFTDAASKTAIDLMWAQGDAEGISVFVSSGDSGSNPSFNGGWINDVGVDANSFATSPNDTAVGGTDTADVLDGTTSKYFNSTLNPVYGSAKSYVPELTWNQSCGNVLAASKLAHISALQFCKNALIYDPYGYYVTSESGSGGPSSVDFKPSWQRIVRGAAKDQSRDLPDVSLFAGAYGGYSWVILCTGFYPCTPNFASPVELVGGTSLSSPMFAGIQALIDQGLSNAGLPKNQGNAAPTLYELARNEYGGPTGSAPGTLAKCNASNGTSGTGKCVFYNITTGGNSTQCVQIAALSQITPDCYFYGTIQNFLQFYGPTKVGLTATSTSSYNSNTAAYSAQSGWSFANGLGSVNAANLLSAWKAFVNAP
ncbi:S53 family peptidase [Dyella nitratireducens]|uniref:Sedolisin-B n=1 Tax=Dyella nitratireducens TaxID=1849580 RepID=A0ABQ1FTT4_9GAMM|nr:protease pro-enzyme activation domain-containing protein [Dyella nitratireducens]GGA30509.1 sedolisin-B [Dyella nitratireducens]GLQ42996.1 sedolisin-B [Dyella nitratireducens]